MRSLQIPVLEVEGVRYSASLSDADSDGCFLIDSITPTNKQSSKPAVFNTSDSTVNLPLVKLIDGDNYVVSLYSAIMQYQADQSLTVSSVLLLHPIPIN